MRRTLAIGALLTSACVTIGSREWFVDYEFLHLRSRAAFELDCDPKELSFEPLGSRPEGYDVIGVRGCDQSAIYVFRQGAWILNSTTR